MKKLYPLFLLLINFHIGLAQVAGDTIVVKSFNYSQTYGSGIRDTMIEFPNFSNLEFEKIYMLYNMRCKNGVVGNLVPPSGKNGCGEWDYSCNTYITDSTKTDSTSASGPSHVISGFSGTTYAYTTLPTYTFYAYTQQNVQTLSTSSEIVAQIGNGNTSTTEAIHTTSAHGKSYYLWTATEISNAGLNAGNINSLQLFIQQVGSALNHFTIRMKHTTNTNLSSAQIDQNGFTEVYYTNTSLQNGTNQLYFHTPFVWNGTDGIIVEFDFHNSYNGNATSLFADPTPFVSGLYTSNNNYQLEFDGVSKLPLTNNSFSAINQELTISFWANGNANFLPSNTSILESLGPNGNREVNIHFPWSNSNFYWDCGNSTAGYDRINLLATTDEIEGKWNHWTFTKNATTGIMNIYKNGNLWHTGSGKTIPIEVTQMILGMAGNNLYPYFGQIDELSIWNKALAPSTIQQWMNRFIDATHPDYASLLAYYQFDEGTGNVCTDHSINNFTNSIQGNAIWRLIHGRNIFSGFNETSIRPKIGFIQGNYTQNITTNTVLDSVSNISNTVKTYQVVNNDYVLQSTNQYYQSGYSYIYDANTNIKIDSVFYPAQQTIQITNLPYILRSPARFQIMSFVTPYGNGLDLGVNGKTWTFDVTDFAPILKGKKRMTMDAGGQWQEDMDIRFLFIVGTPNRKVLDINNIWKVENVGYTNILNNFKFENRMVPILPITKAAKIRTMITGHGQEGEFIPQQHYLNINGGNKEFSWKVWKACADNPVYPQGGTWIYDRAGWCPGKATDLFEADITSFINPGNTLAIDYGLDTAEGASNYWVSNQLVEYGDLNFNTDAAIEDILHPSTKIEYARKNPICNHPVIIVRNTGKSAISSIEIEYWLNNASAVEKYTWTGNLATNEMTEILLPKNNLWQQMNGTSTNLFHAHIVKVNQFTDDYEHNNHMVSQVVIPKVLPNAFELWIKTNLFANETSYKILDEWGNVALTRSVLNNSTNYRDTLRLGQGCYTLLIEDSDDDGLSFWANSDGSGLARIRSLTGTTLHTIVPDFGKYSQLNFTVDFPLSYQELYPNDGFTIYPNPANQFIQIETNDNQISDIILFNSVGQMIQVPFSSNGKIATLQTQQLPQGMYIIQWKDKLDQLHTQKLTLTHP